MARRNLSLFIDARGRSVLHRSGFSWLAFVALPLWALHRRLWGTLLLSLPLLLALHAGANRLMDLLGPPDWQGPLVLGWLLLQSWFMGHWANRGHLALLNWCGYRLTATEMPADRMPVHAPFSGVAARVAPPHA